MERSGLWDDPNAELAQRSISRTLRRTTYALPRARRTLYLTVQSSGLSLTGRHVLLRGRR